MEITNITSISYINSIKQLTEAHIMSAKGHISV